MGLLDDAIREHLDLKRRRGADPSEVERAEREALGPVRRNRDPGDEADPQDQVSDPGGFAYDHEDEEEWAAPGGPGGAGQGDPHAAYDHDEPEFDPIVPPGTVERGSARPRSLSEPVDDVAAPHVGEESEYYEPLGPSDPVAESRETWAAADEDAPAAEPFPTAPGAARHPAEAAGDETTEYRVEDAVKTEGEDGEDMLEETPEFLQDTPDHDRLWFEQRPPRDFDFDG